MHHSLLLFSGIVVGCLLLLGGADAQLVCPDAPDQMAVCPFALWKNGSVANQRNCYECRWCPFRKLTCCEKDDELELLKSINVSGSEDWSCFITIAHFQQCGRCSPDSSNYTIYGDEAARYLEYVPHPECLAISVCEEACGYIYKQCKNTERINDGGPVINKAAYPTKDAFCSLARQREAMGLPCYSAGSALAPSLLLLLALLFVI